METLTDFNYTIGKFVTAPGVPIGMLAGMFDDAHSYIMTPDGYVARRPLAWCQLVAAPEDPDCAFPLRCTVIVSSGRLQGMLGTVVGTLEGRVFLKALHGSNPTHQSDVYSIEMLAFVEDAGYLIPWQQSFGPPGTYYQDGEYLPPYSRS